MTDQRSILRRGLSTAKGWAMDLGLVPYRPVLATDPATWDRDYRAGDLEYYRRLSEAARYGSLLGYLKALGGPIRIVDVGCGIGVLRERLPTDDIGAYVGVDFSAVAVETATSRLADPVTRFVQAASPAGLGPFDVAVCNEVLYVVEDAASLLDAVADELAPGGHLLVSMMRHRGERALWRVVERRFELLDSLDCRHRHHAKAWRVACYRRR